jgi:hypothetical protein
MAADIDIYRLTGTAATPTYTSIIGASTRMSTSDSATPAATNPLPIPSSGSNYTYWVTTQLYAACAPDNSINNVKWYTDSSNTFGTGLNALVTAASSYVQATGTSGSSGVLLGTGCHLGACAASDFFLYTSSCKLPVAGSIGSTTGSFADRVVYQVRADTTASPGNSGEETLTWEYDET